MSGARFDPAGPLRGTLRPPPDKSISHRAAIVAAMAEGETELRNYLDAADTRSTLAAVEALGARVERAGESGRGLDLRIAGVGLRGAREAAIEVGNAGTLLRLLPGWLAGQESGRWTLDGDSSIRRRPVERIAEPLRLMGARIETSPAGTAPLGVEGGPLTGIEYTLPVPSAQVKSCLLLAGLLAEGETTVLEPQPTRDHTERMLSAAGAELEVGEGRVTIRPAGLLEPSRITVPGDFSSAAFWIVAATLVPGSELTIEGVGVNPGRTGLLGVLERMGASVEVVDVVERGGEPVAELVVRAADGLRGTAVGADEIPAAIDELPLVALLGAFAEGETVVEGAAELRVKESDRVATVVEGLGALGAEIEARPDGFAVRGTGGLAGGRLDAHGDHRLALLGAVAGLASRDGVEVAGFDAAAISYPGFTDDLLSLSS